MCAFNIDEIDGKCQFHQHFMRAFCANILMSKITKPNVTREKLLNSISYEKLAHKKLIKLTPGDNPIKEKKMIN